MQRPGIQGGRDSHSPNGGLAGERDLCVSTLLYTSASVYLFVQSIFQPVGGGWPRMRGNAEEMERDDGFMGIAGFSTLRLVR
jgi:hypothetical protein